MASKEKSEAKVHGDSPKPAKRQRKVGFSADIGLEPSSCISLRLVSSAEEMQEGSGTNSIVPEFAPDFAELFFGEDGKIYGYKDLKIVIWIHALSFHVHVEIHRCERIQGSGHGKQQITDLQKVFKEVFGTALIEERDTFLESLSSNNNLIAVMQQCGKRLASWRMTCDEGPGPSWIKVDDDTCDIDKQILLVDLSAKHIREWHSRLTPLVLMFIEAGRPIDQQDPRWEVYVNLEKQLCEPDSPWRVVGFCTVYNFLKYPDSTRLRVSQILVLPPYQGKQNGRYLLEAVYNIAVQRDCYDVTMEEPSDSLQELRDCIDVLRLVQFEPVRSNLCSLLMRLRASSKLHNHHGSFEDWLPSPALVEVARKNLKISKVQLQRCWEVLLFLHVHQDDVHAHDLFRSIVAWRLKVELFGKPKSRKVDDNKQIVDTENEYDSSKTFVMFKVRSSLKSEEVQQQLANTVVADSNIDIEKELHELIEERNGEIDRVLEKVVQHCKSAGTSLVQISSSE